MSERATGMARYLLCLVFAAALVPRAAYGAPQSLRSAPPTNVRVVAFELLKTFLPTVPGWTQGDARGEQLTMPATYARAETRYRKDDGRIELEIVDTATNQLLLAPLAMFVGAGFSERTEDGFKRAVRIGGQPAAEEWNMKTGGGEVTVIAGNRFVVRATGHHVSDIEPIRKLVESVDLAKLAALR